MLKKIEEIVLIDRVCGDCSLVKKMWMVNGKIIFTLLFKFRVVRTQLNTFVIIILKGNGENQLFLGRKWLCLNVLEMFHMFGFLHQSSFVGLWTCIL